MHIKTTIKAYIIFQLWAADIFLHKKTGKLIVLTGEQITCYFMLQKVAIIFFRKRNCSQWRGFYYVHFNAPEDFDFFNFKSSVAYHVKPSTKIRDLFEEIIDELQTKQPIYEKLCVIKFLNILSLLERKCEKETSPSKHYADKISYIMQKMNREYEKSFSLEEYAQMCNMSKFHFLRVFKNIVGTTPIEYRNDIRLEHAKELLTDTAYSIDEISGRVGYTSNTYFCDIFKKKFGKSPSKFRKDSM